jgi:arylsulfatase A
MTRREWLTAAGAAAVHAAPQQVRRPNVLLIMTDDQGYGDLSLHGNPHLKTPNIDRLAAQGVEFTRFYVSPVCAPTRSSLLTGRYNVRCGVHGVTHGRETMRTGETTIAEALRPAGYRTALIGKWHLGEHYPYVPHAQGFDEYVGFRTGHWNNYFDPPLERNGKPLRGDGYISDYFTSTAIEFIERNQSNPFFLYLAYNAPHSPFQVPDRYREPFRSLPADTASVYAMVSNLDENIGKLLDRLDRMALANDTLVVFLTDNGPNGQRFNSGLRGAKGSVYEGGVRVPFILRWPGRLPAAARVNTIAAHIDVYPTILEACAAAAPQGPPIDGRSILPLAQGRQVNWPDRMIFTHRETERDPSALYPGAVRTQRFNLVNGRELYEIPEDPGEQNDVAASHPEVVAKLRSAYESWLPEAMKPEFMRYPIPVGYAEENPVVLPAPQSYLRGNVHFFGKNGYAHDWITNWTSLEDTVHWEIDVVKAGEYQLSLKYLCAKPDLGSRIEVSLGDSTVEGKVTQAGAKTSADVPPEARYVTLDWTTMQLGKVRLPKGRARFTVKALSKPGTIVMDLKEASLTAL